MKGGFLSPPFFLPVKNNYFRILGELGTFWLTFFLILIL